MTDTTTATATAADLAPCRACGRPVAIERIWCSDCDLDCDDIHDDDCDDDRYDDHTDPGDCHDCGSCDACVNFTREYFEGIAYEDRMREWGDQCAASPDFASEYDDPPPKPPNPLPCAFCGNDTDFLQELCFECLDTFGFDSIPF